jgi:hypothetical protein
LVAKHDRGPEVLRQRRQRLVGGQPVGDRVVERGTVAARRDLVLGEAGVGTPAAPPELVDAGVVGDAVGPGRELRAPVEPGEAADDGQERFLRGVRGVGVLAGDAAADRVDVVVVAPQQRVERGTVTGLRRGDQRGVVDQGRDGANLVRWSGRPRAPPVPRSIAAVDQAPNTWRLETSTNVGSGPFPRSVIQSMTKRPSAPPRSNVTLPGMSLAVATGSPQSARLGPALSAT